MKLPVSVTTRVTSPSGVTSKRRLTARRGAPDDRSTARGSASGTRRSLASRGPTTRSCVVTTRSGRPAAFAASASGKVPHLFHTAVAVTASAPTTTASTLATIAGASASTTTTAGTPRAARRRAVATPSRPGRLSATTRPESLPPPCAARSVRVTTSDDDSVRQRARRGSAPAPRRAAADRDAG